MQYKHFLENKNTPQRSLRCTRYFNLVVQTTQTKWLILQIQNPLNPTFIQNLLGATRHCSWCWNIGGARRTPEGAREHQLSGSSGRATRWVGDLAKPRGSTWKPGTWRTGQKVPDRKQDDPSPKGSLPKAWETIAVLLAICWPDATTKKRKLEHRRWFHPNTQDQEVSRLAAL